MRLRGGCNTSVEPCYSVLVQPGLFPARGGFVVAPPLVILSARLSARAICVACERRGSLSRSVFWWFGFSSTPVLEKLFKLFCRPLGNRECLVHVTSPHAALLRGGDQLKHYFVMSALVDQRTGRAVSICRRG